MFTWEDRVRLERNIFWGTPRRDNGNGVIVFPRIISGELCPCCGARDPRWPKSFGIPDSTLLIVDESGHILGSIINIGKDKT